MAWRGMVKRGDGMVWRGHDDMEGRWYGGKMVWRWDDMEG